MRRAYRRSLDRTWRPISKSAQSPARRSVVPYQATVTAPGPHRSEAGGPRAGYRLHLQHQPKSQRRPRRRRPIGSLPPAPRVKQPTAAPPQFVETSLNLYASEDLTGHPSPARSPCFGRCSRQLPEGNWVCGQCSPRNAHVNRRQSAMASHAERRGRVGAEAARALLDATAKART